MVRRKKRPQIARTQNWREYFWAVLKKTTLVLIGVVACCFLAIFSKYVLPPGPMLLWSGVLIGVSMFAVFVAGIWWLASVIGWLWCVLMDLLGSTAEAARHRSVAKHRQPPFLEEIKDDESPSGPADRIENKGRFRPGLPRRRSEGIQE
jgi:hypothetical protein